MPADQLIAAEKGLPQTGHNPLHSLDIAVSSSAVISSYRLAQLIILPIMAAELGTRSCGVVDRIPPGSLKTFCQSSAMSQ